MKKNMKLITKLKYLFKKPIALLLKLSNIIQRIQTILWGIKTLRVLYKTFHYSIFIFFISKYLLATFFYIDLNQYLTANLLTIYTYLIGVKYFILKTFNILKDIPDNNTDLPSPSNTKNDNQTWDDFNKRRRDLNKGVEEALSRYPAEPNRFYWGDGSYTEFHKDGTTTEVKPKSVFSYIYDHKGTILFIITISGLAVYYFYYPEESKNFATGIITTVASWFQAKSDGDSTDPKGKGRNGSLRVYDTQGKDRGIYISDGRGSNQPLYTNHRDIPNKPLASQSLSSLNPNPEPIVTSQSLNSSELRVSNSQMTSAKSSCEASPTSSFKGGDATPTQDGGRTPTNPKSPVELPLPLSTHTNPKYPVELPLPLSTPNSPSPDLIDLYWPPKGITESTVSSPTNSTPSSPLLPSPGNLSPTISTPSSPLLPLPENFDLSQPSTNDGISSPIKNDVSSPSTSNTVKTEQSFSSNLKPVITQTLTSTMPMIETNSPKQSSSPDEFSTPKSTPERNFVDLKPHYIDGCIESLREHKNKFNNIPKESYKDPVFKVKALREMLSIINTNNTLVDDLRSKVPLTRFDNSSPEIVKILAFEFEIIELMNFVASLDKK